MITITPATVAAAENAARAAKVRATLAQEEADRLHAEAARLQTHAEQLGRDLKGQENDAASNLVGNAGTDNVDSDKSHEIANHADIGREAADAAQKPSLSKDVVMTDVSGTASKEDVEVTSVDSQICTTGNESSPPAVVVDGESMSVICINQPNPTSPTSTSAPSAPSTALASKESISDAGPVSSISPTTYFVNNLAGDPIRVNRGEVLEANETALAEEAAKKKKEEDRQKKKQEKEKQEKKEKEKMALGKKEQESDGENEENEDGEDASETGTKKRQRSPSPARSTVSNDEARPKRRKEHDEANIGGDSSGSGSDDAKLNDLHSIAGVIVEGIDIGERIGSERLLDGDANGDSDGLVLDDCDGNVDVSAGFFRGETSPAPLRTAQNSPTSSDGGGGLLRFCEPTNQNSSRSDGEVVLKALTCAGEGSGESEGAKIRSDASRSEKANRGTLPPPADSDEKKSKSAGHLKSDASVTGESEIQLREALRISVKVLLPLVLSAMNEGKPRGQKIPSERLLAFVNTLSGEDLTEWINEETLVGGGVTVVVRHLEELDFIHMLRPFELLAEVFLLEHSNFRSKKKISRIREMVIRDHERTAGGKTGYTVEARRPGERKRIQNYIRTAGYDYDFIGGRHYSDSDDAAENTSTESELGDSGKGSQTKLSCDTKCLRELRSVSELLLKDEGYGIQTILDHYWGKRATRYKEMDWRIAFYQCPISSLSVGISPSTGAFAVLVLNYASRFQEMQEPKSLFRIALCVLDLLSSLPASGHLWSITKVSAKVTKIPREIPLLPEFPGREKCLEMLGAFIKQNPNESATEEITHVESGWAKFIGFCWNKCDDDDVRSHQDALKQLIIAGINQIKAESPGRSGERAFQDVLQEAFGPSRAIFDSLGVTTATPTNQYAGKAEKQRHEKAQNLKVENMRKLFGSAKALLGGTWAKYLWRHGRKKISREEKKLKTEMAAELKEAYTTAPKVKNWRSRLARHRLLAPVEDKKFEYRVALLSLIRTTLGPTFGGELKMDMVRSATQPKAAQKPKPKHMLKSGAVDSEDESGGDGDDAGDSGDADGSGDADDSGGADDSSDTGDSDDTGDSEYTYGTDDFDTFDYL